MYERIITDTSREENNKLFLDYVRGYLDLKLHYISNISNMAAIIHDFFDDISWVGFYLYDGKKLYLGPFQGKPACVEIELGKGVCGTSATKNQTILVPNVLEFEGHIACESKTMSEIVVPIYKNNKLFGVLDIDSHSLNRFDETDQKTLESAVNLLVDIL
ncbi:MAG: GAF domain-containing protein [Candidatus Izemoplasmatales bacterium]|jgi:GAF domain-containing protein|nr:GAF domain-containing protein [Candidatus Izemoplasmatales bacterium]